MKVPYWILPVLYVVAGLMTGAYIAKHWPCDDATRYTCRADRFFISTFSGAFWPVYWGWTAAYEVVP